MLWVQSQKGPFIMYATFQRKRSSTFLSVTLKFWCSHLGTLVQYGGKWHTMQIAIAILPLYIAGPHNLTFRGKWSSQSHGAIWWLSRASSEYQRGGVGGRMGRGGVGYFTTCAMGHSMCIVYQALFRGKFMFILKLYRLKASMPGVTMLSWPLLMTSLWGCTPINDVI